MSLRFFHILFVSCSSALAVGFAAWLGARYLDDGDIAGAVAALISLASAVGMIVYGVRFYRRTRAIAGTGTR